MKKMFFFDIDGTLIECNKDIYSIQDSTKMALDQLQQQGDDVFFSNRTLSMLYC